MDMNIAGQKGSHKKFVNEKMSRPIIIPYHGKGEVKPYLLKQIMRQLNMTPAEFLNKIL